MCITNYYGVECWNSYRSNYFGAGTLNPGHVDIVMRLSASVTLTNDDNMAPYSYTTNFWVVEQTNLWPGWNGVVGQQQAPPSSFMIPLNASVLALTNAIYWYNAPPPYDKLVYISGNATNYLDNGIRELPHFWLLTTNRLQVAIIDYSAGTSLGRIVDYVQLGGLDSTRDLNAEILANNPYGFWTTNYFNNNLEGVYNQINFSEGFNTTTGVTPTGPSGWTSGQIPGGPTGDASVPAQQAFFRGFFAKDSSYSYNGTIYYNTQTNMQAPYTPFTYGVQYLTWQANDPLVHYLASDLTPVYRGSGIQQIVNWPENLGIVNNRYQPWYKGPPAAESGVDGNPCNMAYKDPLVGSSDGWDFPTNKFPNVGWLGRVHRGTPWQSVYLKSTNILTWANNLGQSGSNTWVQWTGDANLFDATNMAPVSDWLLFDLFSASFNDNATRGQLSVNVGASDPGDPEAGLAAWSAVFSGIVVPTNTLGAYTVIEPAGPYNPAAPFTNQPPLVQIVQAINSMRSAFTNLDGTTNTFEHAGDILSVPQLTVQSPFLNLANTNTLNDQMYEWLPQQTMSLLRVENAPRYVIYSYGQTLRPAPGSIVTSGGPFFEMVTNYQVVAETATRSVVRVEGANTPHPHIVLESFNILPPD